jgi:hypothetical protein
VVDVFEEVEDQIRTERYMALLKKAAPWAMGAGAALVIGVVGVWGYGAWHDGQANKAGQTYMDAVEALSNQDEGKATALFGELTHSPLKVYKVAGYMDLAGLRMQAGKGQEAADLYDKAAAIATDPFIKDLARLKSAYALMDTAPYKDIEARLTPLTDDKRPLHLSAREALAFAKLQAGKTAEARSDFNALTLALGAPEGMTERARVAIAMIDSGSGPAMAQAVKDSQTINPQQFMPTGPGPGPDAGPEAPEGAPQ